MPDPAIRQNDVRVQDLARERINPAGPDGGADVVVEPADKIIPDILRVLLHVSSGRRVLVIDFDRVRDADLLEGLVPHQHTLAHPAAVTDRRRGLDVEHDRVLRWADLDRRIRLLQVPSVDVADPVLLRLILAKIRESGREVADALVGQTRVVGRVGSDFADGIVQRLHDAVGHGQLERNLHVARKRLGRLDRGQLRLRPGNHRPIEFRSLPHQQRIQVNHRQLARPRHQRHNRHIQDDPVREQPLDARLRFRLAGRPHLDLRRDQHHAFVHPPPVDVHITGLQPCIPLPTRHGQRDEELLAGIALRQHPQHLVVLTTNPDLHQARCLVDRRDHLLVVLESLRLQRKLRRRGRGRRRRWRARRLLGHCRKNSGPGK